MKSASPGLMHVYRVTPGQDASASAIGNTGVDVVSSPWLVGALEEASHRVVRDLYEHGEATVGVHLDLSHLAPAFPGTEITAHARLIQVNGRKLKFEVRAFQGSRELMSGTHDRVLVKLDQFMASVKGLPTEHRASGGALTKSPIDFYFDFHSPWCWFASLRIEELATRVGRPIAWKPLHLARLIERIDGRRPLDANPAFVKWFKQDMLDKAKSLGLQLRYHPHFPLRPARALRASVFAAEQGKAAAFVQGVMKAYWSEEGDIEDLDLLSQIARECGLDSQDLINATSDDRCKNRIEENTLEAQQRGVFGAPSFICEEKLFWGTDRMDQLESWAA